jgi:hypothetical protein
MLSLHIQNICLDGTKEGNNSIHVHGKIEAKKKLKKMKEKDT